MATARVSICIPSYNAQWTIRETLNSCIKQDYPWLEILVVDDCSTDLTIDMVELYPEVRLEKGVVNTGRMDLERCIRKATGEFIVFMCADDYFTNSHVISDMVKLFTLEVGFVGRYYYQFIDRKPIRVHRTLNPYFSADNPSGLGFRKSALSGKVINKSFIEAASMVKDVLSHGWYYDIIRYDTTAVRIGDNGSRRALAYEVSPIMNWYSLIGKDKFFLTNFVSLIQIKNWSSYRNLFREIYNFIYLRPLNLLRPDFWFFSLLAILTPRTLLKPMVDWYKQVSSLFIKEIRCQR